MSYDVDKYTGKLLSLIGFLYCRQKIKLGSRPVIVIVHFDQSVEFSLVFMFSLHPQYPKLMFHYTMSIHFTDKMK